MPAASLLRRSTSHRRAQARNRSMYAEMWRDRWVLRITGNERHCDMTRGLIGQVNLPTNWLLPKLVAKNEWLWEIWMKPGAALNLDGFTGVEVIEAGTRFRRETPK